MRRLPRRSASDRSLILEAVCVVVFALLLIGAYYGMRQWSEREQRLFREDMQTGLDSYKSGAYGNAERIFRDAVQLNPQDSEAHRYLGIAIRQQRRFDESGREIREAIRLDPSNSMAHASLGKLYVMKGEDAKAEPELRKAISLKADWPDPHHELGQLLARHGKAREAERELRQAQVLGYRGP